jgi:signal transduction histidine kinase/CheY-like chemotaxis protein
MVVIVPDRGSFVRPPPEQQPVSWVHRLLEPLFTDLRQITGGATALREASPDFETYRQARLLITARLALIVGMANVLFWAPTDFFIFGHKPQVLYGTLLFRSVFVLLGALAYGMLRRLPLKRADTAVVSTCLIFAGFSFGSFGFFAKPDVPLVFCSFFLPTLSVALPVTLRQRIPLTLGGSLVALSAYYLPHPEYLSYPYTGMIWVFLIFGSIIGITFGHMVYQLDQKGFEQQKEIRRNLEKLEELNRMKDSFVATVSHELRTPLNAIIGLTDVVLDERISPEVQQYVRTIHNSGQVLLSLINDILDLAKIKSGKMELEATPYSLRDVVEASVGLFAVSCERKGLELSHYVPPDLPLIVGDPNKLNQIVINLIGNAVKFTDAGEVRVEVRWESREKSSPVLSINVTDTGPGVAAEKKAVIFEEFTQADTSTTRKFGGTGLGLPIVRRLVQMMGGDITVADNGPHGSAFKVTLPVTLVEGHDGSSTTSLLEDGRPSLAVVSVRNDLRRRNITDLLRAKGMTVEETETLGEAVELMGRQRSDGLTASVCIIDQPDLTPRNLSSTPLVSSFRRPFIPLIVVLDNQKATQDGGSYRQLGVDAILTRPVRRQHLGEELRRILGAVAVVEPAPELEVKVPVRQRTARILVADDVPENQLLIKAFLNKLPVEGSFAENGREALELFEAAPFDLVMLDIEMPEMDGYEAIRHMREWEQAQGRTPTPIIALTAHGTFEHQERTRQAGFTHHVSKPIRKRDFLWLLNHFVYRATPSGAQPAIAVNAESAVSPEALLLRASYLHRRREEMKELKQLLEAGDFSRIVGIGHKLKGSGASYGLAEISVIGSELELAAQQANRLEVQTLITRLGQSIEKQG